MTRPSREWMDGFRAGYREAQEEAQGREDEEYRAAMATKFYASKLGEKKKPKRKQSGKAKILTAMTAPVWKKYKKGSGRKTYVQIRAQVSRSQAYKRKVRNL